MQRYTVYFIWRLLYMFRVVLPPITRRANNCIYSVWYLSHRYCYLPLSWKSWNWFECAVGGVAESFKLNEFFTFHGIRDVSHYFDMLKTSCREVIRQWAHTDLMSSKLNSMCADSIHLSNFQLPSTSANKSVIETSVFNTKTRST